MTGFLEALAYGSFGKSEGLKTLDLSGLYDGLWALRALTWAESREAGVSALHGLEVCCTRAGCLGGSDCKAERGWILPPGREQISKGQVYFIIFMDKM
jgi:hypothetical protein